MRTRGWRFLIYTLIYLSLLPIVVYAQPAYTVYGTVRLPDGSPAVRVTVTLTGMSGITRQARTDDMGRYQISELPQGRYVLIATAEAQNHIADQVQADTGRGFQIRIQANIFFRLRSDETTNTSSSPVTSAKEAAQRVPRAAQKAFEEGLKEGASRKLEEAVKDFSRAIELYPDYFQALAERGHVRLALGEQANAAADFARALELNPKYGPALRGSGICKFEQGQYAGAVTDLENASSVEPNVGRTFLLLGVAYLTTDRTEAARSALSRALTLDPKGAARARVHLANVAVKENHLQEAVAHLDAYLAETENAPDAEKLRALRAELQRSIEGR